MWDVSEWEQRVKKDVHAAAIAIFGCVTSWHNEFNQKKNNEKKGLKTLKMWPTLL